MPSGYSPIPIMLIYFLAPLLLLLLIVLLFTWKGLRLKADDDRCLQLQQQFADSGEVSFQGRKAPAFILLGFCFVVAFVVFGATTSPASLFALLVALACVIGMIREGGRERVIRLNREHIDCYGKRLPWSAVRASDVLATRGGRHLRLYAQRPVRVALLFQRPWPLLSIDLDAVEHGNALLACVRGQLGEPTAGVGVRY